jgi:PUA domain protein
MKAAKRHFLRSDEVRELEEQVRSRLGLNLTELLRAKPRIEMVKTELAELLLSEGKPVFIRVDSGEVIPTLLFDPLLSRLPAVMVDMGAVPHICNGADVMAPGVVKVEGGFQKGNVVVVVDEKHEKPIAVGEALLNSDEVERAERGKVVKNLHYVGDKTWKLFRSL